MRYQFMYPVSIADNIPALPATRRQCVKGEMTMPKTVWVDEDLCISCGLCVNNLPDVFRFNNDGKAECYDPMGASEDAIQNEAIDVCPVSCIHWKD